ncbi:glycosylhydrolase-like jelly roll fold domain-containing protein [Paenibacillus daejeonensis]|uniref:glycosylhydrolase-like jelly roll fold domain-containing protein n=1 Tax=Paenibacillus daejeonensis TaxID=135193 RepID=UPI0003712538|nr:glycosylhydrolase-like jelly roll fold domain-containing protein [Paenibacillus daejeonensis]
MNNRLQAVLEAREDNYILPLFWLQGENEETMREEIRKVYESGIRAVTIEPRPHPDFLCEPFWKITDAIMDEAKKLGMRVWAWDDDHFPTGHVAGKLKKGPSELRRLFLSERHMDALGPAPYASFIIEQPSGGYRSLYAVIAAERDATNGALTGQMIDVTSHVEGGMLYWPVPEGYWRIFVIEETDEGGSPQMKDYFNPLNRNSVRLLIDTVYEAYYARYKDDFGHTFAGFFSDEPGFYNDPNTYEFHSKPGRPVPLPWSGELADQLRDRLGADYRCQLPLLFHDCGEESSSLRYIYMDLVSSLYKENFGMQIGNWCRERGVEYIGHIIEDNNVHARLGCGAGHFYRALWGQDMAGVDVVLWQLAPGFDEVPFRWAAADGDSEFFQYGMAKMGASLGHLDPKKKGRALAEVFGAYGWTEGLKLMKWLTDHMLVRGINHFVPHAFSAKEYPDPDCPPHMYAQGHNPQFKYYHYLNRYTNRMCHLLSGGEHKATAAVLYHAEAEWSSGEYMYFHKPVKELMRHQIDCDIIPCDALFGDIQVESGTLKSHGETFECLIIPYCEALPAGSLQQLCSLAEQGLPLFFVSGLPLRASCGEDVQYELEQLQNLHSVQTVQLPDLVAALKQAGYYEIEASSYEPYLRSFHVAHSDMDVFMFVNEHPLRAIDTTLAIPLQGNFYLYDAYHNEVISPETSEGEKGKSLLLKLAPYEAVAVLVGAGTDNVQPITRAPIGPTVTPVAGPWTVEIADAMQYPNFTKYELLDTLCDMGRPEKLPTFGGTIRYETTVEWGHEKEPVWLDLGEVYETAEVSVNGLPAGVRISPPYRFEIGVLIHEGQNRITVDVTNTLGKAQRDSLSVYGQQEPTGLIGPVILQHGNG